MTLNGLWRCLEEVVGGGTVPALDIPNFFNLSNSAENISLVRRV